MATLDDVKLLLGFTNADQDDLLNLIISNTEAGLKLRVGGVGEVPPELGHVVTEVAVRRFNRRKNEGMSSYGQEGETITFDDAADFDAFADDIDAWLDQHQQPKSLGTVRFINAYGGGSR